ncbi:peroxiredoxin [Bradyrhizobium sp.]|uniref:peroxiredoxin n=1 Tax=Bradyrhizobium sp. TaxID=376 RepID=UPI001ED4918B|nr:peroxiredoxin [Bradyrhizobium sp.]MBV8921466.1 redoxin domain-containing protein [Bradyrhizobium sp.]MBV9979985.1 redoxin domain-containing protein [Bradyrhizobium sp.]
MSKKSRKNSSKLGDRGGSAARSSPLRAAKSVKGRRTSATKTAARNTSAKRATSASPARAVQAKAKAATKTSATPSSNPARLVEGAMAPSFILPRDGGSSVSLQDFAGKKLVLFFYPRANTPGCTKEAIDFTRLAGAFAKDGTAVLGISADSLKAQESFRDKHKLAVPLLSDERREMLEAYGAWGEKSMYGKSFLGIIRTTVLIDAKGRIAKVWRNVRVDGHAEEVLAFARTL